MYLYQTHSYDWVKYSITCFIVYINKYTKKEKKLGKDIDKTAKISYNNIHISIKFNLG